MFIIPIGIYILIALASITMMIEAKIGRIKNEKLIFISDKTRPSKINTSELATKAKNTQNFSIDSSTFGLILYRP